jgi:hypothetical protein
MHTQAKKNKSKYILLAESRRTMLVWVVSRKVSSPIGFSSGLESKIDSDNFQSKLHGNNVVFAYFVETLDCILPSISLQVLSVTLILDLVATL